MEICQYHDTMSQIAQVSQPPQQNSYPWLAFCSLVASFPVRWTQWRKDRNYQDRPWGMTNSTINLQPKLNQFKHKQKTHRFNPLLLRIQKVRKTHLPIIVWSSPAVFNASEKATLWNIVSSPKHGDISCGFHSRIWRFMVKCSDCSVG